MAPANLPDNLLEKYCERSNPAVDSPDYANVVPDAAPAGISSLALLWRCMLRVITVAFVLVAVAAAHPSRHSAQTPQRPLRIIAFGAHPDDAELKASGVAALWAAEGHKVKLVAMTNGDIGHFAIAGGPLAQRRKAEVADCARILGIETEVLDIHDGELMPSLENRKTVARLIREWQADIVMGHRPYDYHPDHRYTGVLMDDAAVVVVAPFFVPDTQAVRAIPCSCTTRTVSSIRIRSCRASSSTSMPRRRRSGRASARCPRSSATRIRGRPARGQVVPAGDRERQAFLLDVVKKRGRAVADLYRQRLLALYGAERGKAIEYAEAFQLGQYGRQPSPDELKALFSIP